MATKKHWTQTRAGKAKMKARSKKNQIDKAFEDFSNNNPPPQPPTSSTINEVAGAPTAYQARPLTAEEMKDREMVHLREENESLRRGRAPRSARLEGQGWSLEFYFVQHYND